MSADDFGSEAFMIDKNNRRFMTIITGLGLQYMDHLSKLQQCGDLIVLTLDEHPILADLTRQLADNERDKFMMVYRTLNDATAAHVRYIYRDDPERLAVKLAEQPAFDANLGYRVLEQAIEIARAMADGRVAAPVEA